MCEVLEFNGLEMLGISVREQSLVRDARRPHDSWNAALSELYNTTVG
jgi:hypothetical protein